MGIVTEFKSFAVKGNMIELAVAVVLGAAFSAIISSLVDDVITPFLLQPALKAANITNLSSLTWGVVKYGNFIAAVIKFLIVAFVLFLVIKAYNKIKNKEEVAVSGPSSTDMLLMEIRDALKKQQ